MNKKILVIDDDTRLRNLLGKFLQENEFDVSLAQDTAQAREFMKNHDFSLLIVDVMMPEENGIDFVTTLRQTSQIPVIMLTARGGSDDRIKGLEIGANDYLPKPFEPKELLLRIRNILKNSAPIIQSNAVSEAVCEFADFVFSYKDSRLKKSGEFIHITESEARILRALCKNKGEVVSRDDLAIACGDIDSRSIDVQINRIRKKIEINPKQPIHLQTVRNKGYVLRG